MLWVGVGVHIGWVSAKFQGSLYQPWSGLGGCLDRGLRLWLDNSLLLELAIYLIHPPN